MGRCSRLGRGCHWDQEGPRVWLQGDTSARPGSLWPRRGLRARFGSSLTNKGWVFSSGQHVFYQDHSRLSPSSLMAEFGFCGSPSTLLKSQGISSSGVWTTSPCHHEKHNEPSALAISSTFPSRSTNSMFQRSWLCILQSWWILWELGPNVQEATTRAMVMVHFHISCPHHTSSQFSPSFATAEPPQRGNFQASSRNHQNLLGLLFINGSWDCSPRAGQCRCTRSCLSKPEKSPVAFPKKIRQS